MTITEAPAPRTHNLRSPLDVIADDPGIVFRDPAFLDELVGAIEADISAMDASLSSKKGRDAIASKAHSIAKIKTAIDGAGKELNEEHRAKINVVDEKRRQVRTSLDDLRDQARKPLTDWEAAEAKREDTIKTARKKLADAVDLPFGITSDQVRERIRVVRTMEFDPAIFRDDVQQFEDLKNTTLNRLGEDVQRVEAQEKERAELQRLREETEKREAEDRRRAEEEARQKAEADRIAAAEQKAREEAAAEAQRKHDEEISRMKALADAKERETQQRQREEAEAKAAEEARQADEAHRAKVDEAVIEALLHHGVRDSGDAANLLASIQSGRIPHVTITY